jgi:hypothetical protein
MPFLSGQVMKLCWIRQQFCSKHPLCIKIIWCISVLFFIKSGIWAIPGECGAKQNAPIMRSSRAHRVLLAAQLRPSTSSWEIKQIQARRQGASFKLKLEGLCLSLFYPKDKMTTMFIAPDGICQVSQTIQKTAAAQKVAQSHSGLLVV